MKKYNFKTDSGHDVMIETEVSERYYFGLYITCDYTGWQKKWCPPSNLTGNDGQIIKSFSDKLDKMCAVTIPDDIYDEIVSEYNKIRHNTGKLILATIWDNNRKIVKQYIGFAIADVSFGSYITYKMPKDMLDAILIYTKNGKIYDFGGIEDESSQCDDPYVFADRDKHYWFPHFIPKDIFSAMFNESEEEGETLDYELELKLVKPFK